jgi:hypothetical protein
MALKAEECCKPKDAGSLQNWKSKDNDFSPEDLEDMQL